MPIYEYKCTECDHRLEKLQKMNDDPLKDCPECGKSSLTKLVSASSFKLKGSGWYETDFKGGNKKESSDKLGDKGSSSKESGGNESSGKSSESKKSDSKPSTSKEKSK
ncbi:MAG: zinc ribbon domain-containing protein [Kangiellaceae bacterium]|nr:zinc ribbon domain-containing protein [Kangiellaceae bacterium]